MYIARNEWYAINQTPALFQLARLLRYTAGRYGTFALASPTDDLIFFLGVVVPSTSPPTSGYTCHKVNDEPGEFSSYPTAGSGVSLR